MSSSDFAFGCRRRTSMTALWSHAEPHGNRLRPAVRVCQHCLTPLAADVEVEFCCLGCRHVFDLLRDSGLTRYYALRGDRSLAPVGDTMSASPEVWLDVATAALQSQGGLSRFALDIQGLQCGACVWLIEALFKRQPDAFQVSVNPALGTLVLRGRRVFRAARVRARGRGLRLPARTDTQSSERARARSLAANGRLPGTGRQHRVLECDRLLRADQRRLSTS